MIPRNEYEIIAALLASAKKFRQQGDMEVALAALEQAVMKLMEVLWKKSMS
jgi:hypothetical protein